MSAGKHTEIPLHGPRVSEAQFLDYLEGIDYPSRRDDLISRAGENAAPFKVLAYLEEFADRQYNSVDEVREEFGRIRERVIEAISYAKREARGEKAGEAPVCTPEAQTGQEPAKEEGRPPTPEHEEPEEPLWLRSVSAMEKVMVFIDEAYLHHSLKEKFRREDIDLAALVGKLRRNRRLVRAYVYAAKIEETTDAYWKEAKERLESKLLAISFIPNFAVKLGRMALKKGNASQQKGVDILMASDMLRFACKGSYDAAIIITGDGDFTPVVNMVKDEGRRVELAGIPGTISQDLAENCDERIGLTDDFLSDCWLH